MTKKDQAASKPCGTERTRKVSGADDELLRALYAANLPENYAAATLELSRVMLGAMASYERFAKMHGLTYNALLVLMLLYHATPQGGSTQQTISKSLSLPKQTVGSILGGFKKKGYTIEKPSPTDARAKAVSLNDEGMEKAATVFAKLNAAETAATLAVDLDDLQTAVKVMRDYADAFEKGMPQS